MTPEERVQSLCRRIVSPTTGEFVTMRPALDEIIATIRDAVKEERQVCEQEAAMVIVDMVEVPCPDGLAGCEVLHLAPVDRHRSWSEIVEAIQARGK